MILDERSQMARRLTVNTGAAGTYNIGDQIDTQGPTTGHGVGMNVKRGFGSNAYLVVRCRDAFTSGGAATAQFRLVSDDTPAISTSTPTIHFTSGALPVASLTPGAFILAVSCDDMVGCERYLGVQQITGTAAFTGGTVDISLVADVALSRNYGDNIA